MDAALLGAFSATARYLSAAYATEPFQRCGPLTPAPSLTCPACGTESPGYKALVLACEAMWTGDRTRATFIEYYEVRRGHPFWPSSAVVPHNDPTLLFTNAGMNQYKPIFLGTVDPSSGLGKLKNAANSQVRYPSLSACTGVRL